MNQGDIDEVRSRSSVAQGARRQTYDKEPGMKKASDTEALDEKRTTKE